MINLIFALLVLFVLAVHSEYQGEVQEIEKHNYNAAILYTKKSSTGLFGLISDWWSSNSRPHTCSATIVSNDKVVTAGRCVFDTQSVTLIAGSVNTLEPHYKVEITEEEIFVHPEFSMLPPYVNDIAVIHLKTPLTFGSKINKIDLCDKKFRENDNENFTAFGYRESNSRSPSPSDTHLNYIDVRTWTFDECQHLYSEHTFGMKHSHVLDNEFQFCFRLLAGEYSTLGRYIGGPVTTKDKKFLGIVSHYIDGLPQVATSVHAYRDFIHNPKSYPKNKFQKQIAVKPNDRPLLSRLLSGLKKEDQVKKNKGAKNKGKGKETLEAEIASVAPAPNLHEQMRWAEMYDQSKSEESRLTGELNALQERYNKLYEEHQALLARLNTIPKKKDAHTQTKSSGVGVSTQTTSSGVSVSTQTDTKAGHNASTQTSPKAKKGQNPLQQNIAKKVKYE